MENNQLIETKDVEIYNLTTQEGLQNIDEFIKLYNENINERDPLAIPIETREQALSITNVEEYIKEKGQEVIEIINEGLEIANTTSNFKTNSIFTHIRKELKKLKISTLERIQLENYVNFRLHIGEKAIKTTKNDIKYSNIIRFHFGDDVFYYNQVTKEELTKEEAKKYLFWKKQKEGLTKEQEQDLENFSKNSQVSLVLQDDVNGIALF